MESNIPLERLVAVETKMDMMLESQKEVAATLKSLQSDYVRKRDYEEDIAALRVSIEAAKRKSTVQVWLTSTLAALFGVIMTILVQRSFMG